MTTQGYTRPDLLVDTDWLEAHMNDENIRMSCRAKRSMIGETMTGIVTRTIVANLLAPLTRAASSNAASIFRKIGVSIITVVEEAPPITLTNMIPGTLKMLNGPLSMKGNNSKNVLAIPV